MYVPNFIKIGAVVLEEFEDKHSGRRILYEYSGTEPFQFLPVWDDTARAISGNIKE